MATVDRSSAGFRSGGPVWIASMRTRLKRALMAAATAIAPLPCRKARLSRHLTQYCRAEIGGDGLGDDQVVVTVAPRWGAYADRRLVELSREGHRIRASCLAWWMLEHLNEFHVRLAAALSPFARVPLDPFHAVVDLSDGECSGPGILSFCSHDPRAILIPDPGFVAKRGYETYREFARGNQTPWRGRRDQIVWRGSTTGRGTIASYPLSVEDIGLLPRVRLCLKLRDVAGTDVKISGVVQSTDLPHDKERLARAGIVGDFVPPFAWHGFKFAIDIDGNSNAWQNLLTRLIIGCCVLKVASPLHYRQWYYDRLKPWTHYVPVAADLSDLLEQIAWCRANLDACERIAAEGQALAMSLSYESEIASAVERLCAAHKEGRLRASLADPVVGARAVSDRPAGW